MVVLPLFSAAFFGLNSVLVRKGTFWVRAGPGVLLTVLIGPPFFLILATVTGELGQFSRLGWQAFLLLVMAGIVHFCLGRSMNYRSIQLIGASRAVILSATSPLYSIGLAVILFQEEVTLKIGLGVVLIILGPIIMALGQSEGNRNPGPVVSGVNLRRGLLLGLGAAFFWGISPIFIKEAMRQVSLPILGTLIAYTAAALVLGSTLVNPKVRYEFFHFPSRGLLWFSLGGLSVCMAQLLRFWALALMPVTIVVPMLRTVPLFTLTFSFFLNRKMEALNRYVVAGVFLVVLGAALLV